MYLRTVQSFKYENLHLQQLKTSGRHKIKYANITCAFDIETTNIDKYQQAIMYIWQFQCGQKWTITGRTWEEFRTFLSRLSAVCPQDCYIVVYVHNLSFEWSFLKSILPVTDVFAMAERKVLRFRSGCFEFRCSMLHSNSSLEKYLERFNVKSQKIKGFDYTKKRYPWTQLSKKEMLYCVNDVRGLVQAVEAEMKKDGDNLYTIPLTSTGYIRRRMKAALGGYRKYIKDMLPDLECFHALRQAFRGGDTHANRYNAGLILDASRLGVPINSYDISSAYPGAMLAGLFPKGFTRRNVSDFEYYYKKGKACLMHVDLHNVKLHTPDWGSPYIPKAKCTSITGGVFDNGRVLEAVQLSMYVTEIDFEIIAHEYDFDYIITELWTASKAPMPDKFKALLLQLYRDKTALKGIDEYRYDQAKRQFNAAYGCTVQNPCKVNYIFKDGLLKPNEEETLEELIEKYHASGWLPYQWGVYVTCLCRQKLHSALWRIHPSDFVYTDTDSIKVLGDYDEMFNDLNAEYLNPEYSAVDPKGKTHYIGIFEKDASYKRFITYGAKKYAYEDPDGTLHITIAGVNKTKGAAELGRLENFKKHFKFKDAGGLAAVYNDDPDIKSVRIQGHTVRITSNVMLVKSTYTLGITDEYDELLLFLQHHDITSALHYDR